MKDKINILIVDDHKIFRDGLKILLSHISFIGKIHEASNGLEFLNMVESVKPDIVLMDINMPVMGGIEATQKALTENSELRIIVLTTFHDEDYVDQMLMAGVEGYMLKRSTPEEFEAAILKVHSGGNFFSDEILTTMFRKLKSYHETERKTSLPEFTERELSILEMLCQGFNNDKISSVLHVSPKTIEKHKSNMFQKTHTNNTVNLVIWSFKHGIVDITDII